MLPRSVLASSDAPHRNASKYGAHQDAMDRGSMLPESLQIPLGNAVQRQNLMGFLLGRNALPCESVAMKAKR